MFNTNNIFPNRFFIAKTENIIEIANEKKANFDEKYATSKIPIIGKYKINMLTNINISEKSNASVIKI